MTLKTRILITVVFYSFTIFPVRGQSHYVFNSGWIDSIYLAKQWQLTDGKNYTVKSDDAGPDRKNALLFKSTKKATMESECVFSYSFPVDFGGKVLGIKMFIKKEISDKGSSGVLLNSYYNEWIVSESNELVITSSKNEEGWEEYSANLMLNYDIRKIVIEVYLYGFSQLWASDFKILVDGKDITLASGKITPGAKFDHEFDKSSNIEINNLTPLMNENLNVLGKVWGFLKYHHSAVAKGNYNWDYELFRILPKILSTGKDERNRILCSWIEGLGSAVDDGSPPLIIDSNNVKLYPDLAWIENKEVLGDKLPLILAKMKNNYSIGWNYYVGFDNSIGNPIYMNEAAYDSMNTGDAGYRLLALYRYWNMIQYFYPDKYLIGEDWSNVLDEFIPKFVNADSDSTYDLVMLELIARLNDTHANIWGSPRSFDKQFGSYFVPVKVTFIEGQPVVTGYKSTGTAEKTGLQIGDVIISVDSVKVWDKINRLLKYTPASNYPTKLRNIGSKNLLRVNNNPCAITYERNGDTNTVLVETYTEKQINKDQNPDQRECWKFISDDIGYIYPGTIKSSLLPEIMSRFKNTKGLIIDMRCYPSNFIVFSLGAYLMPDSIAFVKFTNGFLNVPGLFTYTSPLKVGRKNPDYYKGKTIIIVNEQTQSQAEYTTMAFRQAPGAIVIGSTTAGADGNVSFFFLPGGIRSAFSGIGVYYPDNKETQRTGIIPDVEIKPTLTGTRENRDELLEKAVELIKESK